MARPGGAPGLLPPLDRGGGGGGRALALVHVAARVGAAGARAHPAERVKTCYGYTMSYSEIGPNLTQNVSSIRLLIWSVYGHLSPQRLFTKLNAQDQSQNETNHRTLHRVESFLSPHAQRKSKLSFQIVVPNQTGTKIGLLRFGLY